MPADSAVASGAGVGALASARHGGISAASPVAGAGPHAMIHRPSGRTIDPVHDAFGVAPFLGYVTEGGIGPALGRRAHAMVLISANARGR